jgi:hypothetical protein
MLITEFEFALSENLDIRLQHFDLVGGSDKFLIECGVDKAGTKTNIFDSSYAKSVKVSMCICNVVS